jgi:uncharacterized repeat protein (TIGR01451 family)
MNRYKVLSRTILSLLAVFLLTTTSVLAADPVVITSEALTEQKVTKPDGKLEIVRIPAGKIIPGGTIIFVNTISNNGASPAEKIAITNPIPAEMFYLDGSASGQGTTISFSVDGGKKFDMPDKLRIKQADGSFQPATAADYTHLRWTLNNALAPKQTLQVEYRARVK